MRMVRVVSFFLLTMLTSTVSFGLELRGRVVLTQSGCPVSGLTIEIDPEKGSSQSKVVTTTDLNGSFSVSLADGRYLVQMFQSGRKVHQQIISGNNIVPLNVSVDSVDGNSQHCGQSAPLPSINTLRFNLPQCAIGVPTTFRMTMTSACSSSMTTDA